MSDRPVTTSASPWNRFRKNGTKLLAAYGVYPVMIKRFLYLGVLLCPLLHAQTSVDNPRLKAALERFPAADEDKDGVLTMAEAKAFKDKQKGTAEKDPAEKGQAEKGKKDFAPAPDGGEKHVYKKVGDAELSLFVYKPTGHKADAKVPAIVFFFGGGWSSGSPGQFERQCKYLAERGMVAVTVDYRVTSRFPVHIEDCIEDAKSAMRWVRGHAAELGVDPERIASGGGSAGGHLGACVSVIDDFDAKSDDLKMSAKPNAMVLFNPAMALAVDDRLSEKYLERLNQGGGRKTNVAVEKVSPLTHASSKQAPCIMFFGTADDLLEGAELYRKDSEKAGNSCKIVTYEGQSHGFFNRGEYYDKTLAEADKFLVSLGWLKSK
jgi:acetyl esterase